jgi:hypothetical protein
MVLGENIWIKCEKILGEWRNLHDEEVHNYIVQ